MNELIYFLNSIFPLSLELREHLYKILKRTEVKKRHRLLKEGEIAKRIYFVEKGLFRCSYLEDSKEVNVWFMKESDMIASVISFFKQQPSTETIYAMENGLVYWVSHEELYDMYKRFPELNYIGRELTQHYYVLSEERTLLLRKESPADRYEQFLILYPGLEKRVPAKHIASYLGIAMETLSRLKNKK